jgi:hypothetical protein
VPLGVVRHLEVVEVEKHEGEPAPVALCTRELTADELVESPMVQEPREGVTPRQFGQATRDLPEIEQQAVVERLASPAFAMSLEHAAEREELCDYLRLAQTESLALPGVVCCELSRVAACLQGGDEGRKRPELPQAAQAGERGYAAVTKRFLDGLDRKIPRRCPQNRDAARVRAGSARMQRFSSPTRWNPGGWRCRGTDPGSTRLHRLFTQPRRI